MNPSPDAPEDPRSPVAVRGAIHVRRSALRPVQGGRNPGEPRRGAPEPGRAWTRESQVRKAWESEAENSGAPKPEWAGASGRCVAPLRAVS